MFNIDTRIVVTGRLAKTKTMYQCKLILEPDRYTYACVSFICLVSEACRETLQLGLLDRRIGPKDMFIVLLYMYVCIYCQLFIKIINCCCTYREIGGQKDYAVFGHCVIQCP